MNPPTALQVAVRNLWTRRVFGSILALLLWALAWLVVPPLLKHELIKDASTQMGRELRIGEIDFKHWTLELTVRDLAVASQDGATTQLAIKRLYANVELESLLRLAPVIGILTVDGPQLRVLRLASGAYDFDDVLKRLAAASATEKPDSASPMRFALFNLSVRDGTVDLDDRGAARQHQLRALSLYLPFLSNLPARRDITVTPQLAFVLNGSQFGLPGAGDTFCAVLDADLKVKFVQESNARVLVSGQIGLTGVAIADAAGNDLLAFDSLKLVLDEVRPLEQQVKIASAALQGPRVSVTRGANGQLNWEQVAAPAPASATASASDAESDRAKNPASRVPAAWQVTLAELSVRDGAVRWHDASLTPAAGLLADELTLDVRDAAWPMAQPLGFKGSLALGHSGTSIGEGKQDPVQGRIDKAALRFEGQTTDSESDAQLNLDHANLGLLAPYLAQFLTPELQGSVNAELSLRWKAPDPRLAVSGLTVDQLAHVSPGSGPRTRLVSVRKVALSDAQIDWSRRPRALVGWLGRGELIPWNCARARSALTTAPSNLQWLSIFRRSNWS